MTRTKLPDDQQRNRSCRSNLLHISISAVLVFIAIASGIFVYYSLFSSRQRITPNQDRTFSGSVNPGFINEQGQQSSEGQPQAKTPGDPIALANSYDELGITAPEASPNPLLPKPVRGSTHNRARWTPTPMPTNTPVATPSPIPTFVGELPNASFEFPTGVEAGEKWIDVNLTSQTLVAYEGSSPVFQSLVSSGTSRYPTVTGQFRVWLRFASQDMNGYRLGYDYFLQDVPYVQYFFEDYALHGTYWHNNFGTPMSHGCVNLPTPAAEWLFHWASTGTLVNIHS